MVQVCSTPSSATYIQLNRIFHRLLKGSVSPMAETAFELVLMRIQRTKTSVAISNAAKPGFVDKASSDS